MVENAKKHGTLVLFLGCTGLPSGEAVALHVDDVALNRRRVDVHENAVEVGGTIHVGNQDRGITKRAVPTVLAPLLSFLAEDRTSSHHSRPAAHSRQPRHQCRR